MSEQVLKKERTGEGKTYRMAQIAMLGALAGFLMNFEFPLPFLAPSFYQMDFSEVPVLVGTFAMGPLAGMIIELIKLLVHFVLKGTSTAGVGDLASYIVGCAFLIPAGLIYRIGNRKTKKHAVIGMAVGTLTMAVVGCFMNAYVLLPMYGKLFNIPIEQFIAQGAEIHGAVTSTFTFVVLLVGPFNIFKGVCVSVIVLLIYKRIRVILNKIS